jgi:heme o synthase
MGVSSEATATPVRALRFGAFGAAAFAFCLVVWGGIVRINGAGMTCPDWPRCRGAWFPALNDPVVYEWTHRLGAPILTLLVLGTVVLAWRARRERPTAYRASWFSFGLLVAQIVVGWLTIKFANSPPSVAAHLALGIGTFVSLLVIGLLAGEPGGAGPLAADPLRRAGALAPAITPAQLSFARLALVATILAFVAIIAGGYMSAAGAGIACTGFPLCHGWAGPLTTAEQVHMAHRLAAYATILAVLVILAIARNARPRNPAIERAAWIAGALVVLQGALGALTVISRLDPILRSVHQANGALLVASLVVLTYLAYMKAGLKSGIPRAAPGSGTGVGAVLADYASLMKLRVMSLLLFTTLMAMMIAAGGTPSLPLVLWTLLGGALAAGASGALNMVFDRDIDGRMQRTSARPIPSGRIAPQHALLFGIALAVASFVELTMLVNLLAAVLAVSGILFYVIVYTLWLKRTSTQNIVIGGAAGAIPPLVGWAAVTGHLGLTAALLFLIIFVWTPPHFWALALIAKGEYAKVNIPMLPVVRGDAVTKRHILAYTVALALVTLALTPLHVMGWVYLACALVLDLVFFWYAWRVSALGSIQSERALYKYSMLYLALLFGAMVVDRFGHGAGM